MIQHILDFFTEYGAWGLMIHSFADAVIFPIPALFSQVSLSLLDPANALWLATVGFIACLVGTPFGYLIGKVFGHSVLYKFLKKSRVEAATALFQKKGDAAILVGAFTPIPFKVFTILSGCMNFPLWRLLAYAAVGRAAKFYIIGILFYIYGKSAEGMVHKVSLYIFIIAVPLLIIFLLLRKKFRKKPAPSVQTHDAEEKQAVNGSDVNA